MGLFSKKSVVENKPKVWQLEEGHVVHPAFVSEGVQYYYIKDVMNTNSHRGLCAIDVYDKFEMRCDRNYLESLEAAMNRILSNPQSINIQELVELRMRLRERLDFALPPEKIIWELAAVMFFDENESPYKYDDEYCNNVKIPRWRRDFKNINDFFLSIPTRHLIILPDISKVDIQGTLNIIEELNKIQLQRLSSLGLSRRQNQDSFSGYNSATSSGPTSTSAPSSNISS